MDEEDDKVKLISWNVNARSIPLIAEVKGIVGNKGRVTVI